MDYFRPIAMTDPCRPAGALTLAGGWCWFDRAERLTRQGSMGLIAAGDLPHEVRERLTAPRAPFAGLAADRPRLMGILNVTPDSFSDGGRFSRLDAALAQARDMAAAGAEVIDIGGESTRPGALPVTEAEEAARVLPVIAALAAELPGLALSADTRKAAIARAALAAGAGIVNDVAAMTFDAGIGGVVAEAGAHLCLMHAQGAPAAMQDDPRYDDVLLDVFDFLAERLEAAEAAGIPRARVLIDPGIGFGKTVAHNLALLRGLSLFHGLGCGILLGASRKRFIGALTGTESADQRGPGSLAATIAAAAQGVQWHRVHDIEMAAQGLGFWRALVAGEGG